MEWLSLSRTPAQEFVVKAIALALFFARVLLFLWRLFRRRRPLASFPDIGSRVHAGVRGAVAAARHCLGRPCCLEHADGDGERGKEVAALVAREILERQGRHMRLTISVLGSLTLGLRAFNAIVPKSVEEQQFETEAQRWVVLAMSLFSFPDSWWSGRLSPQMRNCVCFAIQMVYLTSYVMTSQENAALMLMTSLFCAMLRLIIGMASLKVPHVVFWNIITLALNCYRHTYIYQSPLSVGDAGMVELGINGCITAEIIACFMVIVCAAIYTNLVYSEVSNGVQATKLRRDGAATTRMLELVCDVVVELDCNLAIKDNATRFAAMFSLNPQNVQGVRLQDYMLHDDDRDRFERQLLATKDSEESLPGVMHVTFRGGCGTSISAEIFYLHFHNAGEEDRFLAGIQETPDHRPIADLKRMAPWRPCERVLDDGAQGGSSAAEPQRADDTRTPSRTSESISTKSLLVQKCCRTTKSAQDLSLLACLLTWNVAVRSSSCCAFHGYMDEALRSLTRLRSRRCLRTFTPSWEAQCDQCGLFSLWDVEGQNVLGQECGGCHTMSVRKIKRLSCL